MKILGIETSCDETAAAVVEDGTKILSNHLSSSLPHHAQTGGIIPETAAREQLKAFVPVIEQTLQDASLSPSQLDAIAVTAGPGLFGSLIIGVESAKALSFAWNKPLVPINHLVGHIYANWLENPQVPSFPNLTLVVSGGHSELILAKGHGDFEWLGGTRDDAAGEAFDKTARALGLTYPGGPSIQKAATGVKKLANTLPRPLSTSNDFDFSFSGLKTAVVNLAGDKNLSETEVSQFAAEIQEAIVDSLLIKAMKAAEKYDVKEFLLAGGVAANTRLVEKAREQFTGAVHAPSPKLCVDNGAMIAAAAFFNYSPVPWEKVEADSSLFFD
ncbi:MAG TPA: tRNA (adenosine(37)-N6)-threonylcarbamoyltransferase complex transferase subunit TsaD [Candidatus Saccharimonadales bacterium]|nr:tRNA (adenosine(37)-N6)-threonylcarbamoyltransferase complex transferase subunit TsaD [Candidatus Saccharimonadales bacterium]